MQENNFEQPPSLSQLLRESYLAEARAQQRRGEMSHSDSASSRFQVFLPLKGKGEDAGGQNDSQFPDLSAFLSQEELDKSVNLAQQAIGKKPQEVEVKASASPLTTSNSSSSSVLSSAPPSVVLNTQPMGLFSDASTEPSMEVQKTAGTHSRFTSERKMHKSLARQDGLNRNIRDSAEEFNDRHVKGAPYNLETQSKKEFLNKAADFIEELSSLFKANSSKRVRPRACKAHRTRAPSKGQNEETGCPLSSEDRERAVMPVEVEKKRCSPPVSHLPTVLQDPECAQTEVQKCRSKEEPDEAVSQKAEEQAECLASTETPFQSETVCEPPRFIQKLKSREVLEGTKVQLDCIVAGHPAPEVRWFCEGKELENSPDIQILSSGQLHSLIIAEAFEEDTGRYSCFASNFCGTDSTSAEIYVEGASSSDSDVEQLFDHVPQLQRKPYKASVCRPSVSPARPTVENKLEAATEEPAEGLSTPLTTQTTPQSVPAQIPTELTPVPDHSETSAALPLATEPPVLSVQLSSSSSGVPAEESSIPALSAAPTETSGPLNTVVSSVQPVLLHPTLTETSGPLNLVVSSVQPVLLHPAPTETSGPLNPVVSSVQPVLLLPGTTETSGPLYPMVSSVLHSAPTETSEPLNPVVSSVQSVLLHPPPTKISGPLNPVVSTVQPLLFHPSLTETSGPLQPVVSSVQPVLLLSTQTETSGPLNPVVSSVQPVLFHPAPTAQLPSSVPNHSSQQASDVPLVMAAPVFTKSLQDFTASQGQLVVLECRVKGAPSPQVDWFREGKLLEDSPDYRILQKKPRSPAESEEICTLVIAEVFAEDSGMFTCTASNKYGTVSSSAALKVKGDGSNITHIRPLSSSLLEPGRVPEAPTPLVKTQPEISVSSSIKPHSSTISLDSLVSSTLRLDPLSISHLHLEPHSYTTSRPDPHRTSLPISSSATNLEPGSVNQEPFGFSRAHQGGLSGKKIFPHPKPGSSFPAAETSSEQGGSRPSETLLVKKTSKNQNQSSTVVSLPDPPPNSCLKTGTMTNHKDPRSGSRVGLRVHFKLPEDEEYGSSSDSEEDVLLASAGKEPPPVRAKPKLDPSQLQLLHNQVLMEQQQESESQPRTSSRPPPPSLLQPEVQSAQESSLWPPRMQREPQVPVFQSFVSSAQQISGPPPTTSTPASALTTAPTLTTTVLPPFKPSPAPPMSFLHTPHAKTLPPPVPLLSSAPALSTPLPGQSSTIHASHLNLSPAALSRTAFSSPPAPKLSILPTDLNAQQITSPAAVLRSAHASLMNLTSISSTFNYARPKEFIAAQAQSPIMSPSPTESPVPLLQELAAELNSSAASSPIPPPFSPPLRLSPTRVLKSPTSPPSLVSSPTPGSFLNSMSFLRAQSPPQASSPTSSSSSPSPIQNPVAFLSSVLPSLTPSQPTNAMGLPKGAPRGVQKKTPKVRLPSAENIRESKELLLLDLEKLRLKDSAPKAEYLQKRSVKGETASRLLGPNIPATVFNYDEEYKVSNFEQRLMSEIEFRLERTPVEESDEEVQHDDVPSGRCIAPIFDKKLKNFKAVEGVPVTFSCKVVGVPPPKVYWFKDGKQILRKNTHYKKMREGDGTCALHIESTTSDDDGNYTIMVANPQGRISCSGHLIVQTGPPRHRLAPLHPQRVRSRVQEVEGEQTQERFFRPHFLQAPGDMMAHEGRLCRLDCKVSGLPNPELMWLVNGKPIYPDLTHKMLVRENSVHSLVIDPLMQNDEGTYTCIASNKAGQSSFSLELKVVEKETKHAPQFVEKLQNMGIPEGSPVRLECRVVGMPPPAIFWKKDNETVSKTKDRISMTQDATGYVCLLIQTTTKDDAGWYTVSAKNEAGIISCTCRLDIYAQWHQSVPPPMRKTPRTGSRYAALTGQGLDIKAAFPTSDTSPILFASSPPEATLESEEL